MTIIGVAFTPKETFCFSDRLRYYLTENTAEDVLNHRLEIDHTNLKEHIESYETNAPKIHKITKNIALVSGGDGRFTDIIEGLNTRKNTVTQILQRLKRKGKLNAYWNCHIAQLGKLTSIRYKNGEIELKEQTTDNIWFDSFAPEIKEIFFKKYINFFYLATTQEKIKIVNEFFKEVTELFGGLAGGKAEIAILNEQGVQWIRTQNFTTYASNWCPEKIETVSTTVYAWSSTDWTDILSLQFECESSMLALIFGYAYFNYTNNESQNVKGASFRLLMDDVQITGTMGETSSLVPTGGLLYGTYHIHTVAIKEKGTHVLKLQTRALTTYNSVGVYDRRLSILKGFYQGGTT